MFSYLRFLLQSTNQHGVHSPFVFNYITKGLYQQKNNYATTKSNQWLIQSTQYFKPKSICFLEESLVTKIHHYFKTELSSFNNAEFIIASYKKQNEVMIRTSIDNMNNSQLLLIASQSYPKSFFDELRKNPEIIVMIDFYYGCLISKRTEQLKQNFFIRY